MRHAREAKNPMLQYQEESKHIE